MHNILFLFLVLTIFMFAPGVSAQRIIREDHKIFTYDDADNLKQIDFLDPVNEKIKGTYLIRASDPYLREKEDSDTSYIEPKSIASSSMSSYYAGRSFCIVCYESINENNGSVGYNPVRSICFIIDTEGKIIHRLPENNNGYNNPVITENGKYVGVLYGTANPHAAATSKPTPGFKIYDIEKKVFILDLNTPVGGPVVVDDKIIVTITKDQDKIYKVYVPENKVMFEKHYVRSERNFIRFTSNGFILKNLQGIEVLQDYASYFNAVPFNK